MSESPAFPRRPRPVRPFVAAVLSLLIGFSSGWIARGRLLTAPEPIPSAEAPPAPGPVTKAGGAEGASGAPQGVPAATRGVPATILPMPRLPFEERTLLEAARRGGTSVPLQVLRPGLRAAEDSGDRECRVLWSAALRNPEGRPVRVAVRGILRDSQGHAVTEGRPETWDLSPGEEREVRGEGRLPGPATGALPSLWIEYQAWRTAPDPAGSPRGEAVSPEAGRSSRKGRPGR